MQRKLGKKSEFPRREDLVLLPLATDRIGVDTKKMPVSLAPLRVMLEDHSLIIGIPGPGRHEETLYECRDLNDVESIWGLARNRLMDPQDLSHYKLPRRHEP